MSQWTHVSGCIRLDGLPGVAPRAVPALLSIPSSNVFLEDNDDMHGKYFAGERIPGGSEGTLQYKVLEVGRGLVWLTVPVWGDLRDFGFDDTPELDAWFERIVTAYPLMIRAAHLLVEVERGPRYILTTLEGVTTRVELPRRT